jgi:hypothetical protein
MITSHAAHRSASTALRGATVTLTADLHNVFGDRLRSVVAYGPLVGDTATPLSCLALVASLTISDLEACARAAGRWHRERLATPLILTEAEFRSSLDAFPLEYGEIIRDHVRVFGEDPFEGVGIARDDLRRACETQIKSHLVHLREGFLEAEGRPAAVADLVARSAPAFTALLRHVAWLSGARTSNRADAAREGARAAGLNDDLLADMLALEQRASIPTSDPARHFPDYLAAVEQLARAIDAWRY